MIKITASGSHKTLRPKDKDFSFSPDGIKIVPRAGFEISEKCPPEYQKILYECWGNGWIKPVAHMRDTEYTMELLRK
jgi:hypothetical protein